jgi:hypothetical protein
MGRLILYVSFILVLTLLSPGCKEPVEERFHLVKQEVLDFEDPSFTEARLQGDAASGSYYVRVRVGAMYGPAVTLKIPDSILHKSIRICIEADMRKEAEGTGQSMAISVGGGGKTFYWNSLDMDVLIDENKKWVHISDSTEIPPWVDISPGAELGVFGFNSSLYSYMDYDNLKVTMKTVDYMPKKE